MAAPRQQASARFPGCFQIEVDPHPTNCVVCTGRAQGRDQTRHRSQMGGAARYVVLAAGAGAAGNAGRLAVEETLYVVPRGDICFPSLHVGQIVNN